MPSTTRRSLVAVPGAALCALLPVGTPAAPNTAPNAAAVTQTLHRGVDIPGHDPLWKGPARAVRAVAHG